MSNEIKRLLLGMEPTTQGVAFAAQRLPVLELIKLQALIANEINEQAQRQARLVNGGVA